MSHDAIDFLQLLDSRPDATFNIEHFTDLPKEVKKPKPDPLLGRYPNLTISEVQALIPKLHSESPRELRRLQTLRRWSHEQEIKPFFT